MTTTDTNEPGLWTPLGEKDDWMTVVYQGKCRAFLDVVTKAPDATIHEVAPGAGDGRAVRVPGGAGRGDRGVTVSTCDDHVYGPDGYLAWHEWAQRMSKTHQQIRCDECELWAIWVPKMFGREETNRG